ncbi:MAG: geranylgeranyl reductase family protein [Acidilobaceae archaeon]|nr:geranylgeranyl reductase family protein [Acidilobaceae archaeon]
MRVDYDVVIVGLGPAGASLAYMLKDSGLRVAGVEMGDFSKIWGKPCGDAIGAGNFDKNGLPHPSGDALKQVVRGALIYSPSEEGVLRLTGGEGYMIDRNKYGISLLREASRGVDLLLETKVSYPIIESGKLVGVKARGEKGELELRAKVIVDATGSAASVRKKLPPEWPVSVDAPETDFSVAFRKIVELDYEIEEPEFIRIYFNVNVAPGGYWWFFPKGKSLANIGVGVQLGRGYESPAKIYREVLMKRPDVGREARVISEAGARLPTRRPLVSMVWDNFIAIGDSAYTVDPVHGGGMGYAMTAARSAADAIVAAFEEGDFSARGLWRANMVYMRGLGAVQASLDLLRMFLQTLTNDEIEWAIRKGLVGKEEIVSVFERGEFSLTRHFLDALEMVVRFLGKPSLLTKLLRANDYMRKIKELYLQYPEGPAGLARWSSQVEALVAEYKKVMEIPF